MINSAGPSHTYKVCRACLVSWDSWRREVDPWQDWSPSTLVKITALRQRLGAGRRHYAVKDEASELERTKLRCERAKVWPSAENTSVSCCSFMMFDATWCNFFLKVCDLRLGCFSTTVLTHTTHGKWTDGRYSSYKLLDTCSPAANLSHICMHLQDFTTET